MNKLIFNDVGLWPHSLELCELSRYLLDTGNNVFFLSSNDSFFGNPANPLCNDFAKIITKKTHGAPRKAVKAEQDNTVGAGEVGSSHQP